MNDFGQEMKLQKGTTIAWLLAVFGTLGSLFFSEVWRMVPCMLCWWQRIFMYPLVIILGIGLWRKDKSVYVYGLPLAVLGLLVSIYQNVLIYQSKFLYGVSESEVVTCSGGVSCTEQQLEWLGVINIPLMALLAFVVMVGALWYQKRQDK